MAATCARPVMRSASLRAFSFASAPLLTKNTLAKGSLEKRTRRRAAAPRTRIATALLWNWHASAWRASAALQPGWLYPRAATACPPYRSRTRSPRTLVSHTPCADATSRGYCEKTGARKSCCRTAIASPVVTAAFFLGICPLPLGPSRRGRREAGCLRQAEEAVHPLQRPARCALVEIVECAHHCHGAAERHRGEVREVAARHVLDARRRGSHLHERRVRIEVSQHGEQLRRIERPLERGLHRHVNAAREGPG